MSYECWQHALHVRRRRERLRSTTQVQAPPSVGARKCQDKAGQLEPLLVEVGRHEHGVAVVLAGELRQDAPWRAAQHRSIEPLDLRLGKTGADGTLDVGA
jgi:hypothetical protein